MAREIDNEVANSPTAWFAALERGLRTGDLDLAARAQRELLRLGLVVGRTFSNKEAPGFAGPGAKVKHNEGIHPAPGQPL